MEQAQMEVQSWNQHWEEEIGNTEEEILMKTLKTGMKGHWVATHLRVG